jgi:hypothetical protein
MPETLPLFLGAKVFQILLQHLLDILDKMTELAVQVVGQVLDILPGGLFPLWSCLVLAVLARVRQRPFCLE